MEVELAIEKLKEPQDSRNRPDPSESDGGKLLIENKLIVCALGNLHYQISREKFQPEPEVRGSNPGSGWNFSLEI